MQIELNKESFFVNSDEFNLIKFPGCENLKIYPQLATFEREIGLIKNIIDDQTKYTFINIGISHGGFIPIQIKKYFDSRAVMNVSEMIQKIYIYPNLKVIKDSHYNNLIKNMQLFSFDNSNLPLIDNFDILTKKTNSNDSIMTIIRLEQNILELPINIINKSIILSYNNLILTNHKEYSLTNSNLKIYVSNALVSYFEDRFKHYIKDNNLNYDNLINLCMMVKNAGDGFKKILEENLPSIDRWTFLDTGSTDNTVETIKEVLKDKNGNLYEEPFINFRDSRNRCLELAGTTCKYNIMIDDTYILRGDVRNFLNIIRSDQVADSYNIFINSDNNIYGSDRILKSDRNLKYIYLLHEIIQDYDNFTVQLPLDKIYIEDVSNDYMRKRTTDRKNYDLQLLFQTLEEYPKVSRTLYYIARTYSALENWDKVYEYAMKRIEHPNKGYEEEITDCYLICGNVAEKLNCDWTKCEELYLKCYNHDNTISDPLYCIGVHYFNINQLDKAYYYLKKGFELGTPINKTSNLRTNIYNELLPEVLTKICYTLKDYKLGEAAAERYLNYKNNETVLSYYKIFKLLNISTTKNIFCFVADGGFKTWSGDSIYNEGVGGSETYIIEMAKNIAKITNYDVYVFCKTDKEGIHDNINYKKIDNYFNFLSNHKIHTSFISRYSEYLPVTINNDVENIYFIIHDLLPSGNIIPVNNKIKKIYCMSEWHKEYFLKFYPIMEEKTFVFPNGINIDQYPLNDILKKKNSFIYSSFANRGLLNLLKMFPKIRQRLPDAILNVFCDINNLWLRSIANEEILEIEKLLLEQKDYVTNHGWVSKKILTKYMLMSEIWLYPCTFRETFCVTALEVAASNVLAITNDLAALNNTVSDRGIIIPGDPNTEEWQNKTITHLINILNDKNKKSDLLIRNRKWAEKHDWLQLTKNFINIDKIIFVTAYKDIGRSNWKTFKRSNEEYLNYFINLASNITYKLIVYVESNIRRILSKYKFNSNIIFYDLEPVNTFYNKYIHIEKDIINSEEYKLKIPNERKSHPEHFSAEYNLINHSKINFIKNAKELHPYHDFYTWIDFGCVRNLDDLPKNIVESKLTYDKIMFHTIQDLPIKNISPNDMLKSFDIYLTGSMFIVSNKLVEKYESLYENMLKNWYNNNICDDDQSLVLQLCFENPDMFQLIKCNEYYSLFKRYLNIISREDLLKNVLSEIKNGVFVEIGTDKGYFSDQILSCTNDSILYCIDPYISYENYKDAINNYTGDMLYNQVKQNLELKYGNRVKFVRMFSEQAVKHINEEIDFLYIDGNHQYEYVYKDLELYYPKIKKNGLIIGDDAVDIDDNKRNDKNNVYIQWTPNSYGYYGVYKAFKDFIKNNNIPEDKYKVYGNQFIIIKS